MNFKEALTRKFGPLPAWGWLGILGGGLWWYRSHTSGASSSTAAQANQPTYYGPYGQDVSGSGNLGSSGSNTTPGTDTGSGAAPPTGTGDGTAPSIVVNYPGAGSPGTGKRHPKPKIKPRPKIHKPKPVSRHPRGATSPHKPPRKPPARHPATVHHGSTGRPHTPAHQSHPSGGAGLAPGRHTRKR